jgi:hypothetical protein
MSAVQPAVGVVWRVAQSAFAQYGNHRQVAYRPGLSPAR